MRTKNIVLLVVFVLGGGMVASIGCCSGIAFLGYSGYRSAEAMSPRIDDMFRAIEADRFGETYVSHTTPEFQRITTPEQYEQIGRTIKTRLGPLRSKTMAQFNARQMNSVAYTDVTYNAIFEKGRGTIKASLQKVDGEWKFAGFRVDSPEFLKDLSTATCPKCGKPHTTSAKFCPACGADLTKAAAGSPTAEPASSEEKALDADGSPDS